MNAVGRRYGYNPKRIEDLAQPKQQHTRWIRTLGRRVFWGDQESLWPVSRATLSANATPRLTQLSEPKPNFQEKPNPEFLFSCGRESVLWGVPTPARSAQATPRVEELARPKKSHDSFHEDRPHYVFSCGRSSPIWGVTDGAMKSAHNDYMEHLANAKDVNSQYQYPRGVQTIIPRAALGANPTPRIEALAEAKVRPEGPYRDPMWPVKHYWKDEPDEEEEVSENAMAPNPKKRLWELSTPKQVNENYIPERSSHWNVSKATLRAQPSKRLLELATPQYTR